MPTDDPFESKFRGSARHRDLLHGLQLLRDLHIVNERVVRELGPLPPGGLPVQVKRKPLRQTPVLPSLDAVNPVCHPQVVLERSLTPNWGFSPAETATLTASSSQEPAMSYITLPNGLKVNPNPWPLKFERYSFGARCYNTLRCSIIYSNAEHSTHREEPSGPPFSPDWKSTWSAGYNPYDNRNFAPPAGIDWVSLDGTRLRAEVDFDEIFKDRLIRHDVPREDIPEGWAHRLSIDVLLEVNDRTINVYMSAHIATKEPQIPGNPYSYSRDILTLMWARTY
jgi:hypothetical protein